MSLCQEILKNLTLVCVCFSLRRQPITVVDFQILVSSGESKALCIVLDFGHRSHYRISDPFGLETCRRAAC